VVAFSSKLSPSSGKVVTLLNQLVPFGITSGSYNCTGHSDGDFKCKWYGDAATRPRPGGTARATASTSAASIAGRSIPVDPSPG
jgi:hypothetical protein